MARVLFINAGSEGHINPTIGVVQELISRGEEVVYFCVDAYRERMEKTGAAVRTLDGQRFIQAFISGGRNNMLERINGLLHTADVVIPSILEQIGSEQFDFVIHDSMFGCGRIIAQILKLPAISSCSSFAQSEESFHSMLERADIDAATHDTFNSLMAGLIEKYNVERQSPYEVFCNPAPLTIVYTTRAFQPDGEAFDQTHKFVGPSIATRPAQADFDMSAIGGKSVIYISLGTVFNMDLDFYKLCMEALGNTEHTVVMSVGARTPIAELGDIPGNFIVSGYVPQTEVLQHAKLLVTHGGMNSVHEGLFYEVPLIVLPISADQPIIAGQVARIGAGVRLNMQSLTADRLREAVDQVLGDASFKTSVAAIRESLVASGGYRQAVDEILAYNARS